MADLYYHAIIPRIMFPLIILALSSLTHFFHFGFPTSVVFDEVFYGNFVSSYWQGTYFFDMHPPFFKLLIALFGYLSGASQYSADWSVIGNALPDAITSLRIVPLLAGTVLPIVIYYLCRRLDFSKTTSFLAATLICLENSLTVQSRFILPDIMMLLVGFASILCYLEFTRRLNGKYSSLFFALSTILASAALSIKWTGLTFLFLIIVMEKFRLYQVSRQTVQTFWNRSKFILKYLIPFAFKYVLIAVLIYTSLFAIHFAALPHTGKGDVFMTQQFRATLVGNDNPKDMQIEPAGFASKFFELNHVMYAVNSGMNATHPYSSKWYTWPLMVRPIFDWQDNAATSSPTHSYIYLLGNPFIYWLGTLAILLLIIFSVVNVSGRKRTNNPTKANSVETSSTNTIATSSKVNTPHAVAGFLIVGYLVNLLPFIFIGRVMFIYHYETALIFSIITIAFLIDFLKPRNKYIATGIIITIALIAFLYWSPLTYGTPLTDSEMMSRMWLSSWR